MKKIIKNRKGFTLIELLAVIVILAIIMVIATTQVNKTIKNARTDSFISSYKMIVKEIKSRMVSDNLSGEDTVTCTTTTTTCTSSYDLSSSDYDMTIKHADSTDPSKGYTLELKGKGKFKGIDINDKCPIEGEGKCNGSVITVNIDTDGKVK